MSYPLGLLSAPLWELLHARVAAAMAVGLKDFSRKIRGFGSGSIMGLESKRSSRIHVGGGVRARAYEW